LRIKDDTKTMPPHRFAFLTLVQQCGKIRIGNAGTSETPEKAAFLTFSGFA
jgi:hypothetical protein